MPGESSAVPTENGVGLNHIETSPPTCSFPKERAASFAVLRNYCAKFLKAGRLRKLAPPFRILSLGNLD
jgi:hypothetical protein